jgi:hypothetical protein
MCSDAAVSSDPTKTAALGEHRSERSEPSDTASLGERSNQARIARRCAEEEGADMLFVGE